MLKQLLILLVLAETISLSSSKTCGVLDRIDLKATDRWVVIDCSCSRPMHSPVEIGYTSATVHAAQLISKNVLANL